MRTTQPVRKPFVTFLFPGTILPEESSREVKSFDPAKVKVPDGAFAFQFSSVICIEVEEDGETHILCGAQKIEPTRYYVGGKTYTLEELRARPDASSLRTLISNMEGNGWSHVIQTPFGNWLHFKRADVLLERAV